MTSQLNTFNASGSEMFRIFKIEIFDSVGTCTNLPFQIVKGDKGSTSPFYYDNKIKKN